MPQPKNHENGFWISLLTYLTNSTNFVSVYGIRKLHGKGLIQQIMGKPFR